MPHIIAYYRFSSLEQGKGSSISRQRSLAIKVASERGWSISEELIDEGKSAYAGAHLLEGQLGQFDAKVKAGAYPRDTILLVERFDRLSRQDALFATNWLKDVMTAGVTVVTTSDGKSFTNFDNFSDLLVTIVGFHIANQESATKGKRVAEAFKKKRERAANGEIFTKMLPAWITVDSSSGKPTMKLVQERVAVVKTIFAMALDGFGARSIAKKLNADGIAPFSRAKAWHASGIRHILTNPAVLGDYQPMTRIGDPNRRRRPLGDMIRNYFPAVIDVGDYQTINDPARVAARKGMGVKKDQIANVLAGLARCTCGHKMHMVSKARKGSVVTKKKPGGTRSYVKTVSESYLTCGAAEVGRCQHKKKWRYEKALGAILDQILHLAMDDEFFAMKDETADLSKLIGEKKRTIAADEDAAIKMLDFAINAAGSNGAEFALTRYEQATTKLKEAKEQLSQLELAMSLASGRVTADEHVRRVSEVRTMIDSDEATERFSARYKTMMALRKMVDTVNFNVNESRWVMILKEQTRGYYFNDAYVLDFALLYDLYAELTSGPMDNATAQRLAIKEKIGLAEFQQSLPQDIKQALRDMAERTPCPIEPLD